MMHRDFYRCFWVVQRAALEDVYVSYGRVTKPLDYGRDPLIDSQIQIPSRVGQAITLYLTGATQRPG